MKKIFLSLFIAAIGIAFSACNSDPEPPIEVRVEYSVSSLFFDSTGLPESRIEVYTNADFFDVAPTADWCIVTRGDLRGHYSVSCKPNETGAPRSCTINATVDGVVKSALPVTQASTSTGTLDPQPVN